MRPGGQFIDVEKVALPNIVGRIDDEVAAVAAIRKRSALCRQNYCPACTLVENFGVAQ